MIKYKHNKKWIRLEASWHVESLNLFREQQIIMIIYEIFYLAFLLTFYIIFIWLIRPNLEQTTISNVDLLTPWCRVLLEKLTGLQLVKKFPAFHGTRRFITALTSVRQLSLSWASPIQSIYLHPTSWRSILILSTHQRLGLPVVSFPPVSPPRPYTPTLLTHTCHMPSPSHSSWFHHIDANTDTVRLSVNCHKLFITLR